MNSKLLCCFIAVDEGRLDLVQLALANRCDINVSYPYDVIKEESWAKVTSRYHVGDVQKETKLLTAVVTTLTLYR